MQQAAQLSTQVASEVTEVKRGSSETSGAAGEVLTAAQSLARESDHLKSQVETFLATVRAA